MPITQTSLGEFSKQITAEGLENTFADLYSAIKATVTDGGKWLIHDEFLGSGIATGNGIAFTADSLIVGETYVIATAGTTNFTEIGAANNNVGTTFTATGVGTGTGTAQFPDAAHGTVQTLVLKSLNADLVTYKYAIFKIDIVNGFIDTTTCESWDVTTHTPLNEAWTFHDCASVGFKLDKTDLIFFIHQRYIYVHSFIAGEPTKWSGVVELSRDDAADTAALGVPCWGWVSSTLWGLGSTFGGTPLNTSQEHTLICLPRAADGSVGVNAAKSFASDYGVASYPNWLNTGTSIPPINNVLGSAGGGRFLTNFWDPTKRQMLPVKPVFKFAGLSPTSYGTAQGLKVVAPSGNNMGKIKALVDNNGNYNKNGALKDHWLLNTHHKSTALTATSTSWFSSQLNKTDINLGGASFRLKEVVMLGASCYGVTASNTIAKITYAGGSTTVYPTGKTLLGMKYDGERYIYVGTTDGLIRIDTTNDTYIFKAVSGGCGSICITGKYIVASQGVASLTPVINRFLRSADFSTATNYPTASIATFAQNRLLYGDADGKGNCFFIDHNTGTAADLATLNVRKVDVNAAITTTASFTAPTLSNQYCPTSVKVVDDKYLFADLGNGVTTTFTGFSWLINHQTMTQASSLTRTGISNRGGSSTSYAPNKQIKLNGFVFSFSGSMAGNIGKQPIVTNLATISETTFTQATISVSADIDAFLTTVTSYSTIDAFGIETDGGRIVNSANQGARIWTGHNGNFQDGTNTLGQIALLV